MTAAPLSGAFPRRLPVTFRNIQTAAKAGF